MKNLLSMPFNPVTTELNGDSVFDMNELHFNCAPDKMVRSAMIFIRNTSSMNYFRTYENCPYELKEEYLMTFMFGDISVYLNELSYAWLNLILWDVTGSNNNSILTDEEFHKFRNDHAKDIYDVKQFILSLPMYAICMYAKYSGDDKIQIDPDEIEKTDYDKICFQNIQTLFGYQNFLLIFNEQGIPPLYYTKYYDDKWLYEEMRGMIDQMPFMDLIQIMMDPEKKSKKFIEGLEKYLEKEKEESKDDPKKD